KSRLVDEGAGRELARAMSEQSAGVQRKVATGVLERVTAVVHARDREGLASDDELLALRAIAHERGSAALHDHQALPDELVAGKAEDEVAVVGEQLQPGDLGHARHGRDATRQALGQQRTAEVRDVLLEET